MSQTDCVLKGRDGLSVSLRSVHVEGRLDGLSLNIKVRQAYRNETGKNLETVYTFPLAWGSTLLGLNVELGGKRMHGMVIEKKEATRKYEKAIEDGDTPVMVERSAAGLYTANLGNLKDGEEAVIELEYVQLLRFEQGRIRLHIPTTVAPRYGEALGSSRLAVHETDAVNPLVEYPFTLAMNIQGVAAKAQMVSPSHQLTFVKTEHGVMISLTKGGFMDRDFVLNLEGLEGQSFALACPDGEQTAVLASFCPTVQKRDESEPSPIALKILVDCSGSMQGDSIDQAKRALHEVAQCLEPTDFVSYSRFGSRVAHAIPKLEACTPFLIGNILAKAIYCTEADMGGTELHAALKDTLAIKPAGSFWQKNEVPTNVLLITDGDVWDIENIVKAAVKGQQRIFAVGVGSAPAESLLRDLAEKTGGACELVSPNEDIAGAVVRMFLRMRSAQAMDLSVDWGSQPVWQSALPSHVFPGETLHLFALLEKAPTLAPTMRLLVESKEVEHRAEVLSKLEDVTVARLAGAQRMTQSADKKESLELALRYQLLSTQTNLLLVYVRAAENKAAGLPQLQQVENMMATGWGGYGTVSGADMDIRFCMQDFSAVYAMPSGSAPQLWRSNQTQATANLHNLSIGESDAFDLPAFMRKQADDELLTSTKIGLSPAELIDALNAASVRSTSFSDALKGVHGFDQNTELTALIKAISKVVGDEDLTWALFIRWLSDRLGKAGELDRHAERLIRDALSSLDATAIQYAAQTFSGAFVDIAANGWEAVKPTGVAGLFKKLRSVVGMGADSATH
jgi:Ca-activated chloride channel family protein